MDEQLQNSNVLADNVNVAAQNEGQLDVTTEMQNAMAANMGDTQNVDVTNPNYTYTTTPATPQPTQQPATNPDGTITATPTTDSTVGATTSSSQATQTVQNSLDTANNPVVSLQDLYNLYGQDNTEYINNMYDALLAGQRAQLDAANQINQNTLANQQKQIDKQYNANMNQAAVDYERNRANFNQQANINGINTGTGSQAQLAMSIAYQKNQATLMAAKQQAESELETQKANLDIQYQADIAAAIAENDYKKAADLFADRQNKVTQMTQLYQFSYQQQQDALARAASDAATMAQYGDFSGYVALYGQETADMMKSVWAQQYPEIALDQGVITEDEYYDITGKHSKKWKHEKHGGSGSSSGGRIGSKKEDGAGNTWWYHGGGRWRDYAPGTTPTE